MRIGFVGLGKLGLPTALAIEAHGHEVIGWDPDERVHEILRLHKITYREDLAQDYLDKSSIRIASLEEVVGFAELLFVTIQTPHGLRHEGITRLPRDRQDFDYCFLVEGMREVSTEIERGGEERVVLIVSTVLPGTVRREIKPLLGPLTKLCYNPSFVAMGTVIQDYLSPELVLLGVDDEEAARKAEGFYRTLTTAPFYRTSIENAELIKVLYNTFISTKIAFANTVMELCHKLPEANADQVMGALKLSGRRLISGLYLDGGMGDGGACHPRDNIALSWLSRELYLSFDWFENIMIQRERHTEWLADLVEQHARGRPITILGKAFKAKCNIAVGSPAVLLRNILVERGHKVGMWDPYMDDPADIPPRTPQCYFIGTRHPDFVGFDFTEGSVVLDPWRYIPDKEGVEVMRIGG